MGRVLTVGILPKVGTSWLVERLSAYEGFLAPLSLSAGYSNLKCVLAYEVCGMTS
jgi:hypothetical protein